jgi:hypothetical protein
MSAFHIAPCQVFVFKTAFLPLVPFQTSDDDTIQGIRRAPHHINKPDPKDRATY